MAGILSSQYGKQPSKNSTYVSTVSTIVCTNALKRLGELGLLPCFESPPLRKKERGIAEEDGERVEGEGEPSKAAQACHL